MEWLLQEFEQFKVQYSRHPDEQYEHFKTNINLAWKKLDQYYTLLDDSPAYLAALVLHPRYKLRWIKKHWAERPDWIEKGTSAVEELWKTEYKNRPLPETTENKDKQTEDPTRLQEFIDRDLPSDDDDDIPDGEDEFSHWQATNLRSDKKVTNPIEYWKANQHHWPRLARMAFDMFGIPAMSSEPERTFSDAGEVVTKRRNRLHADTVNACLCLKQWDDSGAIEWR